MRGLPKRSRRNLAACPCSLPTITTCMRLVSILRACHMMASSRYHGIVTSMPGLVPSAGITMDERIRNLMRERGHKTC